MHVYRYDLDQCPTAGVQRLYFLFIVLTNTAMWRELRTHDLVIASSRPFKVCHDCGYAYSLLPLKILHAARRHIFSSLSFLTILCYYGATRRTRKVMKAPVSKLALGAVLCSAALANGLSDQAPLAVPDEETDPKPFLIEVAPGDTRWVSEDEKWELKRVRTTQTETKAESSPAK